MCVSSKGRSRINGLSHRETDGGSVQIRNFQWPELSKKKASFVDNPEIGRFSSEAGKSWLEVFVHPLTRSLTVIEHILSTNYMLNIYLIQWRILRWEPQEITQLSLGNSGWGPRKGLNAIGCFSAQSSRIPPGSFVVVQNFMPHCNHNILTRSQGDLVFEKILF